MEDAHSGGRQGGKEGGREGGYSWRRFRGCEGNEVEVGRFVIGKHDVAIEMETFRVFACLSLCVHGCVRAGQTDRFIEIFLYSRGDHK